MSAWKISWSQVYAVRSLQDSKFLGCRCAKWFQHSTLCSQKSLPCKMLRKQDWKTQYNSVSASVHHLNCRTRFDTFFHHIEETESPTTNRITSLSQPSCHLKLYKCCSRELVDKFVVSDGILTTLYAGWLRNLGSILAGIEKFLSCIVSTEALSPIRRPVPWRVGVPSP
jgi:hypothetical protein